MIRMIYAYAVSTFVSFGIVSFRFISACYAHCHNTSTYTDL